MFQSLKLQFARYSNQIAEADALLLHGRFTELISNEFRASTSSRIS